MVQEENEINGHYNDLCPSFINTEYLEKALQKYENDPTIKVLKYSSKPAVAEGNNFVSLMLRTSITYNSESGSERTRSVIIKTVLENPESAKIFEELKFYEKEMIMYSKVLPKYEKLLNEIGDTDKMYCLAILVDFDTSTLIFEDLTSLDFTVADRKKGVDWNHVQLVVCKIAKYHALSMTLTEREGDELFKIFNTGIIQETEGVTKFYTFMLDSFSDQVRQWPGYEKYADKLLKMKSFVVEQGVNLFKKSKEIKHQTVIHGDLWCNNMMFKYGSDKNPIDLLFIDFQIAYYGSPIFDLIYFTCTSVEIDVKEQFPTILQLYHTSLCYNLDKMGYKGSKPTLFELNQQYAEKCYFEILAGALIGPIMLNVKEEGEVATLISDSDEAKEVRKELYQNEKHQKYMKRMLPIWDKKGLLDPLYN